WEQDFTQGLKTNNYHHGFPDTRVEVETLKRETIRERIELDLLMRVRSGQRISLGKLEFAGQKDTKLSLLRERVRLREGGWLDPIKVEDGRFRLAQLGIFDSVDLSYRPEDARTRDVLYAVKESKETDLSLLFGFGSYELLR